MGVALTCALMVLFATCAEAQVSERAQAALADLADERVLDGGLFIFRGCPQSDPEGRAIFEAVERTRLDSSDQIELVMAYRWNHTYPNCGYAPLDDWFVSVFEQLHADQDAAAMSSFAGALRVMSGLGPITPGLRDAMYRAAEDGAIDRELRETIAMAAFETSQAREMPEAVKIEEGVAGLRRSLPRRETMVYHLSRTYGGAFFQALARVAPTFSDGDFGLVVQAIAVEVIDGRLDPAAGGLDAIRTELARRGQDPASIPTQRGQRPVMPRPR